MHSDFFDEVFRCRDISSQVLKVPYEAERRLAGPVPSSKLRHNELQLHIISILRVWGSFPSFENANGLICFKATEDPFKVTYFLTQPRRKNQLIFLFIKHLVLMHYSPTAILSGSSLNS